MLTRIRTIKSFRKTVILAALFLVAVFVFTAYFSPSYSFAQDQYGLQEIDDTVDLAGGDIRVIVGRIIRTVLGLLGTVALVLIIYAGFLWMTAGGEEDKIVRAKKVLINATIGLAIIMSSFAITHFVLKSLEDAINGRLRDGLERGAQALVLNSFSGSGSLGRSIVDHYPFRNEEDVPRNASIIITFARPVDPSSLIDNTNETSDDKGEEIFGDCATVGEDVVCDMIKLSAIKIFTATSTEPFDLPENYFLSASAMASKNGDGKIDTFIFKPTERLGNSEDEVQYTVHVSSAVTWDGTGESVFSDSTDDEYYWDFYTSTEIDVDPPYIESVLPKEDKIDAPKNEVIQINFSEPINPMTVKGSSGPDSDFLNIVFHRADIVGEWDITNGFKTVKFTPADSCGKNSCGDIMYCLPVTEGVPEDFEVLVRTADVNANGDSDFEAFAGLVPSGSSGVMDVVGNVLDGNNNGEFDDRGGNPGVNQIAEGEKVPDNYWWGFKVLDEIDREPPYILRIDPPVDQEGVAKNAKVEITFSKAMDAGSFSGAISLEEYPSPKDAQYADMFLEGFNEMWYTVRSEYDSDANKTTAKILHREFGPNDLSLYYFPKVLSEIRGGSQNCLYPGQGPDASRGASICSGVNCIIDPNEEYVVGHTLSDNDTGCASGNQVVIDPTQPNVDSCVSEIKVYSPIQEKAKVQE